MSQPHACVVGSGPTGWTCTKVLLERGWRVSMLDFGNLPEGSRHDRLDPYTTNLNRDRLIAVKDLKLNRKARETDVIPSRSDFVSNYFYADTQRYILGKKTNTIVNISLAMGGLSNLWGGAMLPAAASDLSDWPFPAEDLKPFYRQIASWMPILAERDGLTQIFDFDAGAPHPHPLTPQAAEFQQDLQAHRDVLESGGVYFGRAKVAAEARGATFHSGVALQECFTHPQFRYIPDVLVRNIEENGQSVRVIHERRDNPSPHIFEADRVFVACGPVATTQIALRTLGLHDRGVELKTNQNIYMPFFRFRRCPGVSRRPTVNAIELFMNIRNADTRNKFVHIQVYPYGDYVVEPVRRLIGRFTPAFVAAARPFLERVMVMQFMLHSDLSDRVVARLGRDGPEGAGRVDLQGQNNPATPEACRAVVKVLNRNRRSLGGMALPQIMFIDPPGASNHLGGSFPMRAKPGPLECDLLGRPGGRQRTHLVDSTILPSLPATTLTYTVMANAARICHAVGAA